MKKITCRFLAKSELVNIWKIKLWSLSWGAKAQNILCVSMTLFTSVGNACILYRPTNIK